MPTKTWTVLKFGDPDIPIDYKDLDNPFPVEIPLLITNNHTTILYFQATLVSPPAGYNNATENLGSIAAGASAAKLFNDVTRNLPGGRTDENITVRIKAFTDSGYTVAFADAPQGDLTFTVRLFDHTALTLVDKDDFDNGSAESWLGTGAGITTDEYYSAPYELSCGTSDTYKSFTIGAVTRGFVVIHYRYASLAGQEIYIGGILKMPTQAIGLFPVNTWIRFAFLLPINATTQVKVKGGQNNPKIDEIWVITE